ncbi:MAG: exported protein of unknown function [Candidatus Saccharibacteria bacterium]|nr:exported protein of unknown function [Candidatus Saccharibacteria bacterium]
MSFRSHESGAISGLMVAVIGLSVLVLGLGSFAIWAFVSYNDAQDNVDGKIQIAQAQAKEAQGNTDEQKYADQLKQPYSLFKAPDDYCGVSLKYPKTWSVYESEQLTNGGDYKAYFYPGIIPVITADSQYALRVFIEQKNYDDVVNQYENLVSGGKLQSSTTNANGQQGTRLDGNFSNYIKGSAVIYRCRQQTITVASDADTWKTDFEDIIKTINYNN